jgi:hypothetical protein
VEHPNTRDPKVVSPWKQSLDGEQGQAPSWECFAKSKLNSRKQQNSNTTGGTSKTQNLTNKKERLKTSVC